MLRRIFSVAVKKKLCPANPCTSVEFPVMLRSLFRPHYMTWSEQQTIENHAPEYLRNVIRIVTETGLRVYKELACMRRDQIDPRLNQAPGLAMDAKGGYLLHETQDGSFWRRWRGSPFFDDATFDAAEALIRNEHIGEGPNMDLLALGLSATNVIEHAFGNSGQAAGCRCLDEGPSVEGAERVAPGRRPAPFGQRSFPE